MHARCDRLMPKSPPTLAEKRRAKYGGPKVRDDRPSACKRGYGRRWQRFREWYLAAHPLCVDCGERVQVVEATQVHHIVKVAVRPDLQYVEENCMGLCESCHSVRTGRNE